MLGEDRGVSTVVGYALTLGITSLLVTGLLIAGGTFIEDQQRAAGRTELQVVGQQFAADIGAASRLSATVGDGGSVTLERSLPDRVTGLQYEVTVDRIGHTDRYEIRFTTSNPEVSVPVQVFSETPVYVDETLAGQDLVLEANTVARTKLLVHPEDQPFTFHEQDGQVALEAEAPIEGESGQGAWADHRWQPFDDADASGREALTTRPNVSIGGGMNDAKTGPRLDYPIEFETTGTYYVCARMREPPSESDNSDSIHVALDNQTTPPTYGGNGLSEGTTSSWSWVEGVAADGDANDQVTVTVSTPGTHTLNVWMREDGTQFDKIVLTQDSTLCSGLAGSDTGPEVN